MTLDANREEPLFAVVKRDRRLFVICAATGEAIYSPPDFLLPMITSRDVLKRLAETASKKGRLAIEDVIAFQTALKPAPGETR